MLKDLWFKVNRVKEWFFINESEIIWTSWIILAAILGFGIGRMENISAEKPPIKITEFEIQEPRDALAEDSEAQNSSALSSNVASTTTSAVGANEKIFVGSKNGKTYHYPWCPGAKQIKPENQVWFSSKIEAENFGYKPASNCKGL